MTAAADPASPTSEELAELRAAKEALERPGFALRLARLVGRPLETGFGLLPEGWSRIVDRSVERALRRALSVALHSLDRGRPPRSSDRLHMVLAGAAGGAGGMFGLAALPVELPLSTAIVFRSIADIARRQGLPLGDPGIRLACMEVFALGSPGDPGGPDRTSRYWAVRAAHARMMDQAARMAARGALAEEAAPLLGRLVSRIALRYGHLVSQQAAARAIPLAGAATGSALNLIFMSHFQRMARMHFAVKRLERRYGSGTVRELYRSIALPIGRREIRSREAWTV